MTEAFQWSVWRHGGCHNHQWRCIFEGTEEKARAKFEDGLGRLRQGGIALRDPAGDVRISSWAPLHRNRRSRRGW